MLSLVMGRARRWLTIALVTAAVVCGVPGVIRESVARLRDARHHVSDSRVVAQTRFFGLAWTAAMEELRRTIPRDGEYRLVDPGGGSFEYLWVRYGLAPRRAERVRGIESSGGKASEDGASETAPRFVVLAREAAIGPVLTSPAPAPRALPAPPTLSREGTVTRTLASLFGAGLFFLSGAALTALLPDVRRLPAPCRLGLAYFLGVAYVGTTLYALSRTFAVPLRRGPILSVVLLPVAVAIVRRGLARRDESARRPREPRTPWLLVGLAAFVGTTVSTAIVAGALSNPVVDFDGRAIWCARARDMRAEGTVLPTVLREVKWSVTYPKYPVLMPVVQVAVAETFEMDPDDDRGCRPTYALFFPAMVLVLYGCASRLAGSCAAALTALLATTMPFFSLVSDGGANGCNSDLSLGCFWGAGLLLLLLPRTGISAGLASGLLFAAAVLTKEEGLFLTLFALSAAFVHSIRSRRQMRPAVVALLFAGLAAALLFSWRTGIAHASGKHFFELFGIVPVLDGLKRNAASIVVGVSRATAWRVAWGIFFWVLPVVFLAGARAFRRKIALPLVLALGGAVGMYLAAYALTVRDLPLLVEVTWNRFLVQMSLPLLALFALALREALRPGRRAFPSGSSDRFMSAVVT